VTLKDSGFERKAAWPMTMSKAENSLPEQRVLWDNVEWHESDICRIK
jgi:hypothetical protein